MHFIVYMNQDGSGEDYLSVDKSAITCGHFLSQVQMFPWDIKALLLMMELKFLTVPIVSVSVDPPSFDIYSVSDGRDDGLDDTLT